MRLEPIVWVALIGMAGVIATGLVSPILLSRLNSAALLKAKEKDAAIAQAAREEDWRRQDAVADRLAVETRKATEVAERAADEAARNRIEVGTQLHEIHGLVNSEMTARIGSELTALEGQRLLMLEVRDLRLATGGYADPARVAVTAAAIADIDEKIAAVRKTVADRLAAQTAADAGSGRRATDRIVAAIEALPGQHGAPQDVTIVQPNPLLVTHDPVDDVLEAPGAR